MSRDNKGFFCNFILGTLRKRDNMPWVRGLVLLLKQVRCDCLLTWLMFIRYDLACTPSFVPTSDTIQRSNSNESPDFRKSQAYDIMVNNSYKLSPQT